MRDKRGQVGRHLRPGPEAVRNMAPLAQIFVEDLSNLWRNLVTSQFANASHARHVTPPLLVFYFKPSIPPLQWGFMNASDYFHCASRITDALKLEAGEHVIIKLDPRVFTGLIEPLQKEIRNAGAV